MSTCLLKGWWLQESVVKIVLTLLVQSDNELGSPMTVLHDACVGSEICFQGWLDHQSAPNSMGNRRFNHSVVAVVCNVQKKKCMVILWHLTLFKFTIFVRIYMLLYRNCKAKIRPMGHLVYGYKGEGASCVEFCFRLWLGEGCCGGLWSIVINPAAKTVPLLPHQWATKSHTQQEDRETE